MKKVVIVRDDEGFEDACLAADTDTVIVSRSYFSNDSAHWTPELDDGGDVEDCD